jgi:SAM-dependent methyltransferase
VTEFLIPPADLQERRKRCKLEVSRLESSQLETVIRCNVCGSPRHAILATRDRYGFFLRNAVCLDCGLFYLVDRFTSAGYSDFYESGSFRTLSCQFNGWTHTIGQVQADQLCYANTLATVLAGLVPRQHVGRLLDVGGSAGIIAREVGKKFGLQGTVLDPAAEEVAAARTSGVEGFVGSIEEWQTSDRFDLILLCRSVEHVCDFRFAITRIRDLLKPSGLFYVDIVDFMEMCRTYGAPETFTKVDHCYWFTQTTALAIFRAVGFDIVSMNFVSSFGPGFLLRACEPSLVVTPATDRILSQFEEILNIEREWRSLVAAAPEL